MFWFSQVFGLILMLLKNLSYLFTAFDLSGEMNFFFLKYTNLFILCFILYYLYIKRANALKLQYFWFIKLALFHQPLFFFLFKCKSYSSFITLFLVCLICNASQNNKILTQQIGTIFSQFLRC